MHVHTSAGAALLLTASLAVAGGFATADAATTHHAAPTRVAHARSAPALHVILTTTKNAVETSATSIRPGNTYLDVVRGNSGGDVQVLRLRRGYSFQEAAQDFGPAFNGNVAAVRRIDKNVIFYGGMTAMPKVTRTYATKLDAGKYYAVNTSNNTIGVFRVQGAPQKRSLPKATDHVNWIGEASFSTNSPIGHKGWLKQTNMTHQPHFMDLQQVAKNTTKKQVQDYIDSGSHADPPWLRSHDIGFDVVSPGHTVIWKYHTVRGRYLEACFFPNKKDGMPHFFMGMWHLVDLT